MPRRAIRKQTVGITLDAVTFEKVVRSHEMFASGRPGGSRAIPRFVVAPRMKAVRRMLADVDFTGADLSEGLFVGSDFSRGAFYCANLSGCDFRSAILFRADLRGALLADGKLDGANLDEADLRAAVLCLTDPLSGLKWIGASARLVGSSLNQANLSEVIAPGVDFSNCSMRKVRLRQANLKNAKFTYANLDGADLGGARLEGVDLRGAILTGMRIDRLGLPPAALEGVVTDPSREAWARADAIFRALDVCDEWVVSEGARGEPADVAMMDLRPACGAFKGRISPGLNARRVLAVGVDFSGAQLQGAVFDGADLRMANFTGADLRGASFRDARLSHATFRDADLSHLPLSNGGRKAVILEGAHLQGTGLFSISRASPTAAGQTELA